MDLFEDEKANSIQFAKLLYLKRKLIILTVLVCVGISGGITYMLPPKYHSFGIIFPVNSFTQEQILNNPQFGHDIDADQLLQLLESEIVRDSIVSLYELDDYYEVDKDDEDWKEKLNERFIRDVTFKKTKYMSIVIDATTKDPQLSADIVNSIIEIVDGLRGTIFRGNMEREAASIKLEYQKEDSVVTAIINRIYELKNPDDPKNLIYNHLEGQKRVKVNLEDPFINSPEMEVLIRDYKVHLARLLELEKNVSHADRMMRKPIAKTYKVDRAIPSHLKASPSYSVNLLIAFFGSLVLIILTLVINERIKQVKQAIKAE